MSRIGEPKLRTMLVVASRLPPSTTRISRSAGSARIAEMASATASCSFSVGIMTEIILVSKRLLRFDPFVERATVRGEADRLRKRVDREERCRARVVACPKLSADDVCSEEDDDAVLARIVEVGVCPEDRVDRDVEAGLFADLADGGL